MDHMSTSERAIAEASAAEAAAFAASTATAATGGNEEGNFDPSAPPAPRLYPSLAEGEPGQISQEGEPGQISP